VGSNAIKHYVITFVNDFGQVGGYKAGLDTNKRLTNHSARKYLVQKLKDNNVENTDIMQISGHKSVQSVRNYSAEDWLRKTWPGYPVRGVSLGADKRMFG
jgi:integrase